MPNIRETLQFRVGVKIGEKIEEAVKSVAASETVELHELRVIRAEIAVIGSTIMNSLGTIEETLRAILVAVSPLNATLRMTVIRPDGTVIAGDHLSITLTDVQSVPLSLQKFVPDPNAGGKTVEVPVSTASWSSSNSEIVSVDPQTGPTTVAKAVGPDGTATITVNADGLTATLEVTVVDSEAASVTIVPGTPTP